MDTNDQVRLRRLRRLFKMAGGLQAVAEKVNLKPAYLQQIDNGTLLPPQKDTGLRSPRALGSAAARQIEAAYDLPSGWMDWPLDGVDYEAYVALSEFGRAEAQVRMADTIRAISQNNKLVNIHKKEEGTKSQIQSSESYSGLAESNSSAKNSDNARGKFRAATEDLRGSSNASNKHVRVPRKRGGGST